LNTAFSVIVPLFNEEENLEILTERIQTVFAKFFPSEPFEVLYINDGSSDRTQALLERIHNSTPNFKYTEFSRNFGQHNAIAAGLDQAKGDLIIIMDGDLQDRPESIPLLYEALEPEVDLVCAIRDIKRGSFFRRTSSQFFWWLMRKASGLQLHEGQSIMRIFRRNVLESLREIKEPNRFYSALFQWVGFKQETVTVPYDERFAGETKYTLKSLVKLTSNALFGFSNLGMYWLIFLGALLLFVSMLLGFFKVMSISELPNQLFVLIGGIGLTLIALGAFAVHYRQSLRDKRERPLYIVKKKSKGM